MGINRWILSCQNRVANIWYNQNYTVFGLNPAAGGQPPGDANIVTLQDLGNGNVALQCGGGYNAYASVRNDYGYQVQFQAPGGMWITGVGADEILQAIPTGDGYFALHSPTFGRYVTINPSPDTDAQNCNPLVASTGDLGSAARFTAIGLDRNSIFDLLQVSKNASGFSFAGVNLANQNLSGCNLSLCDFRYVASLNGGVLDGANLQQACFAGLHLAGLQISGADCTEADFTGCDFTSFRPGTPPPVLAHADLTGAVVPAGISWSGANMPGTVLAQANLSGCDLSGTATDLTAANFTGLGVTLFTPVYHGGGIGGYNLASPADRAFAYDYDGTGKLDHLVCYRPGNGAIYILKKTSDQDSPDAFTPVYHQGDGGSGIGGYNLASPADRVIAYDYDGTGKLDHLVCYRPGTGAISILKKASDEDSPDAFSPVYHKRSGIGGYDLVSPADRVIAYDYDGTGKLDHLDCFRPGGGAFWIVKKTAAGPATLARCNLRKANLSAANLVGIDLTTTASLAGANLSGTQLPGTKLAGVDLTGAILVGTNFTGTDLTSVRFSSPLTQSTDPNNPTIFASCTLPYAVIGLDWSCLDLTSTTIVGLPIDLTGLVATGVRRPGGNFEDFVLDGANFANATLDNAHFNGAKLRPFKSRLANFAGARLISATFNQSASGGRAVLDQVSFQASALGGVERGQAAEFTDAFISNCNFTQANLYAVNFSGATLLSGNILSGATNLQETNFSGAYLPNADFTGASLEGANFDYAFMVECVLTDADVTPAQQGSQSASLHSACLQGAAMQGIKLAGANLDDAAITNVDGQIDQQYYDEDGNLTPMLPMRYPAPVGGFPAASSFSNQTLCPNGDSYGTNVENGLTIAQMMVLKQPPTQWSPPGAAQTTTTTTLSSNLSPSHFGDAVTLTAVVTNASGGAVTGTVEFFDGRSSIGTANLGGTQANISTSALSVGTHSLTAHYQGTSKYAPSTSPVVEQTVLPALISTSVVLTSAPDPSTVGQVVDFTATVTDSQGGTPTGNVTISETVGGSSTPYGNGNLSNGVAVIQVSSLVAGSHPFMYATYGGDATHPGATSPAHSQQVNAK